LSCTKGHIERILLGWVEELAVPIRRGLEVTVFAQDDAGVEVHLGEDEPLRTAYLVGADGGRSRIRTMAGIDFVGPDATRSHLIAEVKVTEETPTGIRLDDVGIHAMSVMQDGRTVGIVVTAQHLGPATEPTLADLRDALTAVYGTAGPDVLTRSATDREHRQPFAVAHDRVEVVRGDPRRRSPTDEGMQFLELIGGLRREAHQVVHRSRSGASRARSCCGVNALSGAAWRRSYAGATLSRSQASTARSRAASARRPSRMTSLSDAYSPEATFERTRSAISWGNVTLICLVVRIANLPIE